MIAWMVGLSCLNALFYRFGGIGKPFNTRYRDIGCSLVNIASCLVLGLFAGFWASLVVYLLTFGLSWGAYSAYWGLDEKKWGFWAHGLGLSLSTLPIAWITGNWIGFGIRIILLTGLISLWSEFCKDVNWEEGGRGFLVNITLPLLLI